MTAPFSSLGQALAGVFPGLLGVGGDTGAPIRVDFAGKAPAFVVFQTDGEPDSRPAAERAIRSAAKLPIFWQFVGFGNHFEFLKQLDTMEGRAVDNAGFFPVGGNPAGMADQTLLNKLMHEYPRWLEAARAQGIVR